MSPDQDTPFEPADWLDREDELLAPYAMRTRLSLGRRHLETQHAFRTLYQRDRDRVIHSTAFRRLMYKTQVLVAQTNDHHRTRLTHTLEVAQISRTIARQLGLNEDLTEAIALAHDLGHPPFGHAGESALNECMSGHDGFEHNQHGLRIVELLEYRYAGFPGLNLSHEVLEAMAHHSSRHDAPEIAAYRGAGRPLLEAQVVDAADSLAYNTHDVDDALGVGLLSLDDLQEVEFWRLAAERALRRQGRIGHLQVQPTVVRALIDWQVSDLLDHTRQRLRQARVRSVEDVRQAPDILVGPGPEVRRLKGELEAFLHQRVYRHSRVLRMATKGRRILQALFTEFCRLPELLPERYARRVGPESVQRVVCDYLAGMTDRFAQDEYLRLFQPYVPVEDDSQRTGRGTVADPPPVWAVANFHLIRRGQPMFPPLRTLWHRLRTHWQSQTPSGLSLLWILRGCFGAIIISLAMLTFDYINKDPANGFYPALTALLGIFTVGVIIVLTDILVRSKQITTISAVYFGLLLGLLLGPLFSVALEPFLKDVLGIYLFQGLRLLITAICCYVTVSLLLQTKDEFRFIIPYVEFSKQVKGGKPLVLDTSVIIDGRIADICDTRFIDTKLIVPRFVLQELQAIADSSDKLKRNRGRRGLDMLKRMQNNPKVDLQMHEANIAEMRDVQKVDERLVILAKVLGARVVTNDYNLNKIAQLQGVDVINLNELANALKTVALPGETLALRLVKQGDQIGQGIGYLDDGTMVVVEQGRPYIGQEVLITVTSVLQTPAGRMIFGRIDRPPPAAAAVAAVPVPPSHRTAVRELDEPEG